MTERPYNTVTFFLL